MIGRVEKKTAEFVGWLHLNSRIVPVCSLCASGMRVKRKGFWNYIHPPNSKTGTGAKRCANPYWWIITDAKYGR